MYTPMTMITARPTQVRKTQQIAEALRTVAPDTSALLAIQGVQQQLNALQQQLNATVTSPTVPGSTNTGLEGIQPLIAKMVNESGVKLYPADVVVQYIGADEGVTLTNTAFARAFGSVAGDSRHYISNFISTQAGVIISAVSEIGSAVNINVGGVANIRCNTMSSRLSIQRGDYLATDNTNRYARRAAPTDTNIMGQALEALAHGTEGIIAALIFPPIPIPAATTPNPLVITDTASGHATTLFQDTVANLNEFTIKSQVMRGNPGNALTFDGSTKYVTLASNITLGSTGSISFWVKPTWLASHNMFCGDRASGNNYFSWYQPSKTWSLAAGGVGATIAYDETALEGTWIHIMLVRTGGASYELYVNNADRGAFTTSGAFLIDAFANIYNSSYWLQGLMDEFAVFDHALNLTERNYEWNSGAGVSHTGSETGLLNVYHFDQTSGTNVPDSKGSNAGTGHATITADWVAGHVAGTSALTTVTALKINDNGMWINGNLV